MGMVLCAYGSQPTPTDPPYVWVSWVDANSWLGTVFAKFSWLAQLIQPVLNEINAFCSNEPVQPVYPGDATVAAAAYDPVAFETVITFLKQSATWWVWSQQCQCKANPSCTSVMSDSTWNGMTSIITGC